MKKRTLILASALFLAVGGAFAYNVILTPQTLYYKPAGGGCDDIIYDDTFCPDGTQLCKDIIGGNLKQLYTEPTCTTEALKP